MPYTPEHKSETRERILRCARHLFNRKGFSEVTIDEIMRAAGLTRGGFYKHFSTKEELYADAITQFTRNHPPEKWQSVEFDPSAEGARLARMIVNAYLSREHLDDLDGSCPLIGLPNDIVRGGEAVKAAYRQVLEMMVGIFATNLAPGRESSRDRALTIAALCVGGMVLARAVGDEALSDQLREAARNHALASSGWGVAGEES
jgi:AcrR family transcriptional regulator